MTDPIDLWFAACPDPATDPMPAMREAGLLAPLSSYREIARIKAALVERTGLLGVGGIWGGRQMVGRWFIEGFGTQAQKSAWLGKTAAVSISEPGVGAHPKQLTTRAVHDGSVWRITGEKAWTSNGPIADVLIVLAITSETAGRKQYSMLLVPRDTAGLTLKDMPGFHALRPSRHAQVILDGCEVPADALLGPPGRAYDHMALPFRDVEDAVGTFGVLGAFRFLLRQFRAQGETDNERALWLGGLVALTAVYEAAAASVVAPLDQGIVDMGSATLVGLRLLAAEILRLMRGHAGKYEITNAAAVATLLDDIEATFNVARGPRLARQARLGTWLPRG
jgi:acyl-CoA dehydrogenase